MHVVATAGHVDHGKSALVRALTGMEPDRWAEERRRGLTIDLGYAWTALPRSGDVAFVDVPGHRRFIGNMLAGLGPVPCVLLVVAADEGWRAQTQEHLSAIDALRLRHGLLVVTRADLADPGPALADARARVARSSLGEVPALAVSAVTGEGLPALRDALDTLCAALPAPRTDGRVRLWVDRAFTVRGSGTVVTGTLGAGTLRVGDRLELAGRPVTVRGLHSLGAAHDAVAAPARVAVNLRGVPLEEVGRGMALLTPDAWPVVERVDVALDADAADLPQHLTLHVGTSAVPTRVRPLAGRAARLTLAHGIPLEAGDRTILRDPGAEGVLTGADVVDVRPPELARRGAGARRGEALLGERDGGLAAEVTRRGVLTRDEARLLGHDVDENPAGVRVVGEHLVADAVWEGWEGALARAVDERAAAEPLDPWLSLEAARAQVGAPTRAVVEALAQTAGLEVTRGRVARPGARPDLGAAQAGLDAVLAGLADDPFAAPEAHDLTRRGLGPREIAAAVATGALLRLPDDVLLLPTSPARAMRVLAALPQPFTTSEARQALGTTRRVAIPLLEHLDSRGWTRRLDAGHREVVR